MLFMKKEAFYAYYSHHYDHCYQCTIRLRPDWPWGATNLPPVGHWKLLYRDVMLSTRLRPVLTLRMSGAIPPFPTYFHRDTVVSIATGFGLDDRGVGVQVPVGSRIFSSPHHPDWLLGPPSLLLNGYRGLFPRG
jgi:hypothetical protein